MYLPELFQIDDNERLYGLLRRCPSATLVRAVGKVGATWKRLDLQRRHRRSR